METNTTDRTYIIRNSEKCYRFKPDAFDSHAPPYKGIYELVTFDEKQNPKVLYVGAAFETSIQDCLKRHAAGTLEPSAEKLFGEYSNLYFDFIAEMNAKTIDDAQDVYWYLIQKNKPLFNDVASIKPSNRPGSVTVTELE